MLDASDQAEETLSSVMELGGVELANKNVSLFLHPELIDESDPEYRQFLADVWVGIVLSLMVLVCVCCMCSCLLYHKFQQWKRSGEFSLIMSVVSSIYVMSESYGNLQGKRLISNTLRKKKNQQKKSLN